MKILTLDVLSSVDFNGREFGVFQDGELLAGDIYSAKSAAKQIVGCQCGATLDDADLELYMLCEEHREHAAEFCEICNAEDDEEEGDEDDSDEE